MVSPIWLMVLVPPTTLAAMTFPKAPRCHWIEYLLLIQATAGFRSMLSSFEMATGPVCGVPEAFTRRKNTCPAVRGGGGVTRSVGTRPPHWLVSLRSQATSHSLLKGLAAIL